MLEIPASGGRKLATCARQELEVHGLRVLFTFRSGLGHFHPLLALASSLKNAGHSVRFACPPEMVGAVRNAGFDAEPIGLSLDQSRERTARDAPEMASAPPEGARLIAFARIFADIELMPRLEDLLPVVRTWRPALIVHEMAEFAAPLAAALEGIPAVNHSWGPIVAPDVMAEAGRMAARHWRAVGLPEPDRGGMYAGLYLDVCPPGLQEAHIVSVPRVQPMRHTPVPSEMGDNPAWLEALGRRDVVTVTLGTLFNARHPGLYRVIVEGLAGLECDVVVALGPGVDASSTLEPLPKNAQAFSWVPWSPLLRKTAVVVGHGGASSTLGPLALGVPVVIIPLGADHFVNARRVAAAGAGVILARDGLEPSDLRRAVEAALSVSVRQSARRIAAQIAAMPAPPEVVPILEAYALEPR